LQLPTPLAHSPVEPTSSVRPRPIARRRKARVAWDAYRNFAARGGGKPAADAGLAFGFAAAGHDAAANAIEAQNTARANLAASPEQRALARSIVVRGGSSTDADVDAITNALLGMPPARLTRIRDDGVRIASSRGSITDHAVDLRGVAPRGWPPGSTFDTVPGVYRPEKKDVIISTIEGPNGTRVVSNAHGSYDMVLHELGHAVDGAVVENASTDARFAATRERDLAALPEYMRQPGEAGASETYAEAFARYYGADPTMRNQWPALYDHFTRPIPQRAPRPVAPAAIPARRP